MGVWEYISAIMLPALHKPEVLYIIILAIIGTDAYVTMFAVESVNQANIIDVANSQVCTHPDLLDRIILATPILKDFHYCNMSGENSKASGTGFAGGVLTGILHVAQVPKEVVVTSAELFLVMLLSPFIYWIATHHLGK